MNSYMNIQVRVIGAGARAQLKGIQAQLAAMTGATAAGTAAQGRNAAATRAGTAATAAQASTVAKATTAMRAYNAQMGASLGRMNKWGNQVQWTGRQLQRNWTLPLLLAGGAAVKFSLDNEKAFVHTEKVYGDAAAAADFFMKKSKDHISAKQAETRATQVFSAELDALKLNFEAVSERYGVALKEVNEISGAWAAAGYSGAALAKAVDTTMQAVMLGNMDAATATKALIATQGQYRLNSEELIDTLYVLNAVENQTGIELSGLIEGFQRSAGVAKAAGVGTRELAAQLAALVPVAGTAAQAGNALKTIYSRLLAPTGDTVDILGAMGINIADVSWKSANLADRLHMVTQKFNTLSDAQKAAAASTLGSRWQFNKLIILLDELQNKQGFYAKALNATTDESKIYNQAQQELNAILDSSPNKLKRVWVAIQNGMANAIAPLIPVIISLFDGIRRAVKAFQSLSPEVQKFWIFAALGLAILPLLVVYVGSLWVLIATLGRAFLWITPAIYGAVAGLGKFLAAVLFIGPYKLFRRALSGAAGAVVFFGRILKINAAVTAAWAAITALIHNAFWGGIILTWAAGWMKLQAITAAGQVKVAAWWALGLTWIKGQIITFWAFASVGNIAGWAKMVVTTLAGSLAMSAASKAGFVRMYGTMVLMLAAMWTAFTAHLIRMAGAVVLFGANFSIIWATMWARVAAVFVAFQQTMLVLFAVMKAGWFAIWVQIHVGLVAISTAFSKGMAALWAAMHLRLAAITAALGGGLQKVWGAIHIGLAAISKAFWTQVIRMWIIGMSVLASSPKMLLLAFKRVFIRLAAVLLGPWGLAIAAVVGLLYTFREQIATIWNRLTAYFSDSSSGMVKAVLSAWNALPQGVANALSAVARVVAQAVTQIAEWLSYLNPFARHSPSLVDNVRAGTVLICRLYGGMTATISSHIKGAYRDIKAYGNAVAHLLKGAASFEEAQNRAKIKKFAPGALDEYIQLGNRLRQLQKDLAGFQRAMDAQQAVVDRWADKLDAANEALDKQRDLLDKLSEVADKWRDKLDAAQESLDYYANAPLEGMHAANEAIFANEMAQKALRLEMMRIEEVTGPLDELRSKMDEINGAQELLRGEQAALRAAGAGSDILSGYQDQIDLLDQQKEAYEEAIAPLNEMQKQLEELERQAEMMDLENSLKFDPLTHAIENAANAMEELPFDEVMAGITQAQADIANYTIKWEEANAAVEAQQAVVDAATKARDALQDRLDMEQKKLDEIKEAYDAVNQAIGDIESTMNDVMAAADKMANKLRDAANAAGGGGSLSPALEGFNAAAGGNFPDVGGSGMPIRKDWESQVADIEKMTDELQQKTADMFGDLNPFKPIEEKAKQFYDWMKARLSDFGAGFKDFFVQMLGGDEGVSKAGDMFLKIWAGTKKVFGKIGNVIAKVWDLLGPELMETIDILVDHFKNAWKEIGPELTKFGKLIKPTFEVFKTYVLPILAFLAIAVLGIIKVIWDMFNTALRPILSGLVTMIKGMYQVIRGLIEWTVGILTGDWAMAWQGAKDVVIGIFNLLWGLLKGVFGGIWGLIKGFVTGIWDFFVWLYDILIGHSVIPDIIQGVWFWFKKLVGLAVWVWNNVLKPVWKIVKDLWNKLGPELRTWAGRIKNILSALWTLAKWIWNNILKPIWDRFVEAKTKVLSAIEAMKSGFREKFDSMKQKAADVVEWIRDIPQKLENQVSKWKAAGKALIDAFVDGMKNAAGVISGIAGNVWTAVKSMLNAAIDKINNALEFKFSVLGKDININIADIPHLYTGGVVRGSQKGMLAILGDKGYDEAVIPIEGPWAPKVGSESGLRSGTIGNAGAREIHLHFYGDLEFPNVKSGDDAESFVKNLEILSEAS